MRDVYEVAGTIAEKSGWGLSNLSLQKLAYLAQMVYLGETDSPLFAEDFEAWDYGPVVPSLYHSLKMFGAEPVRAYSRLRPVNNLTQDEARVIDQMVDLGRKHRAARLVALTHWDKGAWAQVYAKGIRGLTIPKQLIKAEFDRRMAAAK